MALRLIKTISDEGIKYHYRSLDAAMNTVDFYLNDQHNQIENLLLICVAISVHI